MNLRDPRLAADARGRADPVRLAGPRHVAVLMAVRNGERFLAQQLASLEAQTHDDWSLVIGDDGSGDGTVSVVLSHAASHPARAVRLVPGPRAGFQANFLALLERVPAVARFVAFCDQDDVWLPGKLSRALASLEWLPDDVPALYGARTVITDQHLSPVGFSPRFRRAPSFRNALVQSIAGGNTMVMNRAAADLLSAAARRTREVVSHDWWAYQVVSGAGGEVVYDPQPSVLYRQHGRNLVGASAGMRAKAKRVRALIGGEFHRYTCTNLAALNAARDLLSPENRALVDRLIVARQAGFVPRLAGFRRCGVYRQTLAGTLALWAAVAAGKL